MQALVIYPTGRTREVKNLGWLRRHASEVHTLRISARNDGARCGAVLSATLHDGTRYSVPFHSTSTLRKWIVRRCLSHAAVIDELETPYTPLARTATTAHLCRVISKSGTVRHYRDAKRIPPDAYEHLRANGTPDDYKTSVIDGITRHFSTVTLP